MHAEERPFLEVEWTTSQLGEFAIKLGIVSTPDVFNQEPFVRAANQLVGVEETNCRLRIRDSEGCPQSILVGDDPTERPTEGVSVEFDVECRGPGNVVGGPARCELMSVPEQLLLV